MKQKKNPEPKNSEILETINNFATYVEKRFDKHDKRFDSLEEGVSFLKRNMVTKIHLDERIGEFRGDITELVYKGDRKFVELVHTLENKETPPEEDTVRILSMPPFPLGQAPQTGRFIQSSTITLNILIK